MLVHIPTLTDVQTSVHEGMAKKQFCDLLAKV